MMQKIFPKFLSPVILIASLGLISFLPVLALPETVEAGKPEYSIAVTSSGVVGQTVTLSGTASSEDFAGQFSQYHVDIFWGDGAESENVHNLTQSEDSFSGTWAGNHTFTSGGLKTIIISLCHQNCTGAEGADASVEFEVVLPAQCEDGVDNDGDNLADYPADPGCTDTEDDDEFNAPPPVLGCTDPTANNYNPLATQDDGSCTYTVLGCTDPTATNYNPLATVDDGSCTYPVPGCIDPTANNYNPNATQDDGSCVYPVPGCTNPSATNYNPLATQDDGSCIFPPDPVPGCTDPTALNFNPNATEDDGSCTFPILGCTNPNATNYNPLATPGNEEAENCTFPVLGCTDPEATNFDPLATQDDDSCVYPPVPQCSDDQDNDNDGKTDFSGSDPGCVDANDNDETDSPIFQCSDGVDNDSDGNIDYPADAGCSDLQDDTESGESTNSGDSGGGGGGGSSGSRRSTQGQVLGATTDICTTVEAYMRRGYKNNVEQVKTLQNFLNGYMQSALVVDGLFGPETEAVVRAFQATRKENILAPWGLTLPTGIFYKTSLVEAKRLMCNLVLPTPSPAELIPWSLNPKEVPPKA